MSKIGFILPPTSRFAGAIAVNKDLFEYLSQEIGATQVTPETDYFYRIETIGTLLNYFTLHDVAKDFEYIIGTSFATLPFAESSQIIQMFHSLDTASYGNVIQSLSLASRSERKTTEKWLKVFDSILPEKMDAIEIRQKLASVTEKHVAELSRVILCVAPCVKSQLVDLFGIEPDKIKIIYNGIPDYWYAKSKSDFTSNPAVHYPTRLTYGVYTFLEKGHDRCYEIFSKINNRKEIYVNLTGMTPESGNAYIRLVEKSTQSNVNSGLLREQLQDKYEPGDIILTTSRTEACQLTLLEGMASKLCPVTYPVGIAPELIKDGQNGFIVTSAVEAVKRIRLLTKNPDLRKKIGQNAHDSVKDVFRMDKMFGSYKEEIDKVIKE